MFTIKCTNKKTNINSLKFYETCKICTYIIYLLYYFLTTNFPNFQYLKDYSTYITEFSKL